MEAATSQANSTGQHPTSPKCLITPWLWRRAYIRHIAMAEPNYVEHRLALLVQVH